MNSYFELLSQGEYSQLKEAVALIALLIAGADGEIDEKEKEWALKIAKIRTYKGPEFLKEFYIEAEENFENKLHNLYIALPKDHLEREQIISERLEQLNPILAKLDQSVGATVYKSFTTFAHHVAKASGGFLRMWSVSKAEAKLVDLPMLFPIIAPLIEEEE